MKMQRFLLVLLACLALTSVISAQIYALEFKDPKFQKSYKDYLYEWNGNQVVLVEIRGGFIYDAAGNRTYPTNARLEFFVQDPSDPLKLPYVLDEGGVKKANKRQVIGVAGERFGDLKPFMLNESFFTLSVEYQRRLDSMATLRAARLEAEKGSGAWFALHTRLVMEMEGLQAWLAQTGYVKASNLMARDLMRESKLSDAAKDDRINAALESVKTVPTPDALVAAATKVGGADLQFRMQESKHIRMIYHTGISDARVMDLLALGERTIEAFRVGTVDPYLNDVFLDKIPETLFIEYFFNTDSSMHQEKMLEEYYGMGWGEGEQRKTSLASSGSSRTKGKLGLSYWRCDADLDLECVVVHRLGHELARHHYGIDSDLQDWLEEGVGYYLSFNLLNRNNVTCSAFKPPPKMEGTVAQGPKKKAKATEAPQTKVVMKGLREVMAGVAFHAGTPMAQLTLKKLFAFENEDMAKSCAFYSFLADNTGKEGQIWLRGINKIILEDDFQNQLRLLTEKCFADISGDATNLLEQRWKEYIQQTYNL
jgi:hypothetical protein